MTRIWFVSALSWRVSGVTSSFVTCSMPLMWPTSVDIPVLITRIVPAPRVTWVFMNARSTRSPRAASAATASTCLGTGTLSPVRADSSISSVAAVRIRPSAGTRSPASMFTMSPGTSSSIASSTSAPSRRIFALTTIIFWRAATLALALPSWLRPMAALSRVRAIRTTPVATWLGMNRLRMPAAEQDDLHRVLVLAHERLPARLLGAFGELVRAESRATRLGLGGRQALGQVDGLAFEGSRRGQAMPGHRLSAAPARSRSSSSLLPLARGRSPPRTGDRPPRGTAGAHQHSLLLNDTDREVGADVRLRWRRFARTPPSPLANSCTG